MIFFGIMALTTIAWVLIAHWAMSIPGAMDVPVVAVIVYAFWVMAGLASLGLIASCLGLMAGFPRLMPGRKSK